MRPSSITKMTSARRMVDKRCDHNDGFILHESVQRLEDEFCRSCVQARSGLVQDEERRIANYRSRNRDSLALTARQRHPTFAENRVIAFGQFVNKFTGVGQFGRLDDLLA